jgi:hypothetical protein
VVASMGTGKGLVSSSYESQAVITERHGAPAVKVGAPLLSLSLSRALSLLPLVCVPQTGAPNGCPDVHLLLHVALASSSVFRLRFCLNMIIYV